jgi:23S rRNA pseudouridine1911/1915/1917 synthase
MSEPQQLTVPAGVHRERADKIVAMLVPEQSRAALQRAFEAQLVRRGGVPLDKNDRLSAGETFEFSMPETKPSELRAVAIPLDVLYEDEEMVAINKPSGMVAHPGAGTGEDTLVHALLDHCAGQLSGIGGVERPGIVHRLDRETSGLMLVAKTDRAHRKLAEAFAERSLVKEYLALVAGVPALLGGTIRLAIIRHATQRHKMTVTEEVGAGREARTDWQRVEAFGKEASLLRCRIHTGRTHQVRVHLRSSGHPIFGDVTYGWRGNQKLTVPPARVMLHAERIALKHPVSGQPMELRAPLPADFLEQVEQARRLFTPTPAPLRPPPPPLLAPGRPERD